MDNGLTYFFTGFSEFPGDKLGETQLLLPDGTEIASGVHENVISLESRVTFATGQSFKCLISLKQPCYHCYNYCCCDYMIEQILFTVASFW